MPAISPALVPTIAPGSLFTRFTTDNTLNVRWLTARDPAYFEVLNRPIVDNVLRSLILAKAVDNLYVSLGHEALYPYLIQPQVGAGSTIADVPITWIWSLSLVMPNKWSLVRLAQIQRISGNNDPTGGYTGNLRLLFSGVQSGSAVETYLFYVDYQIDSTLTYQIQPLQICTTQQATTVISADEANTISGHITFQTLSTSTLINSSFLDLVAPPLNSLTSIAGFYETPAIYEIVDQPGGGGSSAIDSYALSSTSHGTGIITESAWTGLPQLETTSQAWLDAVNYPFGLSATRTSVDGIMVPLGIFQEFQMVVPAGDEPSGTSGSSYSPVWLSQAQLINNSQIRLFFSTYNISEAAVGGAPSLNGVVFSFVDVFATGHPGDRLPLVSTGNLLLQNGADAANYNQHFGRGHLVLSDVWNGSTTAIGDWYATMQAILTSPQTTDYTQATGRLGSYGMASVPRYTPTVGMNHAMYGSTGIGRFTTPVTPNENNRYVCEQDQGLGNTVDLEAQPGITPNSAIQRFGYTGGLCHRIVNLTVLGDELGSDPNFYTNQILPRLVLLLGRDPQFGDCWFNGTRFVWFNGDSWQG